LFVECLNVALSGRAGDTFECLLSREDRQQLFSPSLSGFDPKADLDPTRELPNISALLPHAASSISTAAELIYRRLLQGGDVAKWE